MSSTTNKLPGIVPLNEKNYPTWSVQMKMYLIRENLMGLADGTTAAPTESTPTASRDEYNLKRNKALADIVLCISPDQLYLVGQPTDPQVVWTTLQEAFQKNTWSNKLRLKKKLYKMQLKGAENLSSHLKEITEVFQELALLDATINDEDKVIILLSSLPEPFDVTVTALEAQTIIPNWNTVADTLRRESEKLSIKCNNIQSLVTETNSRPDDSVTKKQIKCHFCNKNGHLKKNCFKFLRYSQNNEKVSYIEHNQTLYASALSNKFVGNDMWNIDSGSSTHMSGDEELCKHFSKAIKPIDVQVGNGSVLQAISVGDISVNVKLPNS